MGTIKSNERELSGKIAEWLNEHIKRNNYPFTSVSNEAGIKGLETTKFADLTFWKNREKDQAFSLIELKKPAGERENLTTLKEKALNLAIEYAFTWNFQELKVYRLNENELNLVDSESRYILADIEHWKRGDVQATIKAYLRELCEQLVNLQKRGKLRRFTPDKVYFVNLFRQTAAKLIPEFELFIKNAYRNEKKKKEIQKYVAEQGIAYPSDNEYYQLVARQRVYGFLTKIIFYLTVRRFFKELPDLLTLDDDNLSRAIQMAFERARRKDWQAVFVSDPLEKLGIPENSYKTVEKLLDELRIYQFQNLPEDVIGELFEEIIEPHQRHNLGQYFTNVDLVDFVTGAIVKDKNGTYSDPTCGSGTFLIRLYDRLRYLSGYRKSHENLLNQIWGFDIGKFPAELSTINLFRQNVAGIENFPRVRKMDIFQVKKGATFDFPPPNAGGNFKKIALDLPAFDGFVGNFPFIRQELIEKKSKGYKKKLTKILAEEYFFSYPRLFDLGKIKSEVIEQLRNYDREKQIDTIHTWIEKGKISLKLSGKSDIYAYIYIHLATLLAEKGAFAIITSNSWLDVSYGAILKKFFLDHFKIKMIAASWKEPWFEDAAVNTIVTVLEKENNLEKRQKNLAKFVKFNRTFKELIPQRDLLLESSKRWQTVDDLHRHIEGAEYEENVHQIAKNIQQQNSGRFDIRMMPQQELASELKCEDSHSKWGKHLRAPDVYYEILEKCGDKLIKLSKVATVRRGYTTGINEYFYLKVLEKKNGKYLCENKRGWRGEIEKEFLKLTLKSPKEVKGFELDEKSLKNYLFLCDKSKKELKKDGKFGALEYIEWGAAQKKVNSNTLWYEVPSVKNRTNWWTISQRESTDFFTVGFVDKKHRVIQNTPKLCSGDVLFEWNFNNPEFKEKIPTFLNSTLFYLFIEVNGRANLGDGALKVIIPDLKKLFVIKPKYLEKPLPKLQKRKVFSVYQEVKKKDRQRLDTKVMQALGLDPSEYLPKIYDGLCQMVHERLELPKMRKKQQKKTQSVAYDQVKASVEKDILPHGVKPFPKAFFDPVSAQDDDISAFLDLTFDRYSTAGKPLTIKKFFGQYEVDDIDGVKIFQADSEAKAEYAQILARPDHYELKIPHQNPYVEKMVKEYKIYVLELLKNLEANAKQKLHNWSAAERMAKEILEDYGLKKMD
jgi:hypothetical protein